MSGRALVTAAGLRQRCAAAAPRAVRRTAAGRRRLLAEQPQRQLQVELRVLVVLVVRERAAERLRRKEQEAQPLSGIVTRGESKSDDPEQVRGLRLALRVVRCPD